MLYLVLQKESCLRQNEKLTRVSTRDLLVDVSMIMYLLFLNGQKFHTNVVFDTFTFVLVFVVVV